MRRKDREVVGLEAINEIIKEAEVCRVGFSVDNKPYIVPMNFGYQNQIFYFHCAKEGRKIEMLKSNPQVCFELDIHHKLIEGPTACDWTMTFASVMGEGTLSVVEDLDKKEEALNILMYHYSGKEKFDYPEAMLRRIAILKLDVTTMTGKRSK